jgi:hypothetical protein
MNRVDYRSTGSDAENLQPVSHGIVFALSIASLVGAYVSCAVLAHVFIASANRKPDPVGPGGGGLGDAMGFFAEWLAAMVIATFSFLVAISGLRTSVQSRATRSMFWIALALAGAVLLTTIVLCAGIHPKSSNGS